MRYFFCQCGPYVVLVRAEDKDMHPCEGCGRDIDEENEFEPGRMVSTLLRRVHRLEAYRAGVLGEEIDLPDEGLRDEYAAGRKCKTIGGNLECIESRPD